MWVFPFSPTTNLKLSWITTFVCLGMEFSHRVEKVQEAGHLLEEAWFFGNSLDNTTKTKSMSRCFSDPCPSSNCNQGGMLVKKSKKKIPTNSDEIVHRGLITTPSLPTFSGEGEFCQEKERFSGGAKKSSSRPNLARAPSLPPPCIMASKDDEDDQEREFTMGRLIRQASLNSSQMLPPKQNSKVMTQSISIPRQQQQHQKKKTELQSTNMEGCNDGRKRNPIQSKGKKSTEVEFEGLKGFKDLGLRLEKEDINMISAGLTRVDQMGERKPWRIPKSQPPSPSIPAGWVDKRSAEDMKAQIKFWARAVASNVRQEC